MSDEDETMPAVKKSRVFYGSLEDSERQRLAKETGSTGAAAGSGSSKGSDAVKAGIQAGNINISS
ncbi:hypothetical protein LDENG_00266400, partial [Lucifuga dentata]